MSQLQELEEQASMGDIVLYMEENSNEFQEYISNLKMEAFQINPKSLCYFCWCKLSNYQKQRHTLTHEKGIRSPAKYCNADDFKRLAEEFAHNKTINGKKTYPKIKDNPLILAQIKKMKLNDETLKKDEVPITINLNPKANNTDDKPSSQTSTSTFIQKQEIKPLQVKFNFVIY